MGKLLKEFEALSLVEEIEKISELKFLGFIGEYESAKTKAVFYCKEHGQFNYDMVQVKLKIKSGKVCPRCNGGSGKLSSSEREIRAKIACERLNLNFKYCGEDVGYKTRIYYCCNKCEVENSARLGNLEHGKGCGSCKLRIIGEKRSKVALLEAEAHSILTTLGLQFIKIEKRCRVGSNFKRSFIDYVCPTCNRENSSTSLHQLRSLIGCKFCLGNVSKTEDEVTKLVEQACVLRGYSIQPSGLFDEFKGIQSKLKLICPNGHLYNPTFDTFQRLGCDCACFKKGGFDNLSPATFYVLKFMDNSNTWLKFGISKDLKRRQREYRKHFLEAKNEVIVSLDLACGEDARRLENQVKIFQRSASGPFLSSGDGYTETIDEKYLGEILQIIKNFTKTL